MTQPPDTGSITRLTEDITRPLETLFFLMPGFPIYALIPAVESLRIANQNSGKELFHWKMAGSGAPIVRSGAGMTVSVDGALMDESPPDLVLIFAGNEPTQNLYPGLLSWLRTASKHRTVIVGVDTGVFAMAEAGLLDDRVVTLHWEAMPLFREYYPEIRMVENLYRMDGPIVTCAGGMAVLDMMLEIIRIRHGDILAQVVANGFVYSRWRSSQEGQRSRGLDHPQQHPKSAPPADMLSALVTTMEENLDTPLRPAELARRFNMSRRTLERLFRRKMGESVARYYMKLRIDMARDFLFYSEMDILSVAIACGFSSRSAFSRVFQKVIGITPNEFRRLRRTDGISPYRPRTRYHLKK